VTTMLDRYFGVPQQVVRSGLWKKMKPGEKDLYIYLLEQSERYQTRELRRTDTEISQNVGVRPRTLCNARKKLQEHGLIRCLRGDGNKYRYTLCDPATGHPYPGNPKERIPYAKREKAMSQ
jgi:hypothetical protein